MAEIYLAPNQPPDRWGKDVKLFLAGSIDMGKAEFWQDKVIEALKDYDIRIFNPRRADWDSSWEQSIHNDKFREQVDWEHEHLLDSTFTCFYFDPNGLAPITLMELGMNLADDCSRDVVVCCPDGYWRKGNVEIICDSYGAELVTNLDAMIAYIQDRLKDFKRND